ncbi:hypothetical protein FSARC_12464 [Fusarium sarcochroum]|uniref:Uncharacterized protein n=1 Tax=Fusarium sarcochroum TaxID=1208366 RepID=A0A8H4T873_9HYPO|nr:hypothetical protein FSARC_12464 [Fusarium sarcochroum]
MIMADEEKPPIQAPTKAGSLPASEYRCYRVQEGHQPHTTSNFDTQLPSTILEPEMTEENSQATTGSISKILWDTAPVSVPTSVGTSLELDNSSFTPMPTPVHTPMASIGLAATYLL